MHCTIYYAGLRRRAFILDYLTRHGEPYIEVMIAGYKIVKTVHASAIR